MKKKKLPYTVYKFTSHRVLLALHGFGSYESAQAYAQILANREHLNVEDILITELE